MNQLIAELRAELGTWGQDTRRVSELLDKLQRMAWERDYYLKIVKRQRAHIEHMAEKMTDLELGPEIKS